MTDRIPASSRGADESAPPGSPGIWIFLFVDMVVFGLLFMTFLGERHRLPEIFVQSRHHLNAVVGLANTLILLTSSWSMVEAVHAARTSDASRCQISLCRSLLLGVAFAVNKFVEYHAKFAMGLVPATNSFFTFYYTITGLHFLHVLGGMIFMLHCLARAGAENGTASFIRKTENVGLYWHFVDVLWLFIFPMLYLMDIT